jgi:endonuclease/exonuclease/phosphatase family metal-dependent hydrolase
VTFSFIRGFTWADAKLGGKRFRFIDTHLESETSTVALAQAKELLAGPVKKAGRQSVIVACDCNSDPLNATAKPGDIPHLSAYRALRGRLTDEWLRFAPASKGFTSGLSETVDDPDTSSIDHRIDFIWGRDARGKGLKVDRAWITGLTARKDGLWASDHAGVVVELRL